MNIPLTPQPIDREELLKRLRDKSEWDAVIIGGGATGLGIAVEAAARGLRVALIEARDFASGTSSRSTKLIHGGVRYLAQGNIKLVREALAERAVLLKIAPHIVHPLEFIVPCYRPLERPLMRVGLGIYDMLAGEQSIGPTQWLSREETLARLPGVRPDGLRGGVSYWDAQFDDAAMAIALMQTAYALGATPINYVSLESFTRKGERIGSAHVMDTETGEHFELKSKVFFNAAGVWVDRVRQMADASLSSVIQVSQGSHIVVDAEYLPGKAALLVPKTRDGRVLFAVPWLGKLLIGTTDVPRSDAPFDPQPSDTEIDFLLSTASQYLQRPLGRSSIRAMFAGLRPLFSPKELNATAAISREHAVLNECENLISVVGGKWTTFRRMAEDALKATRPLDIAAADCRQSTRDLVLLQLPAQQVPSDLIQRAAVERSFTQARTGEDILARRLRLRFLNEAGFSEKLSVLGAEQRSRKPAE